MRNCATRTGLPARTVVIEGYRDDSRPCPIPELQFEDADFHPRLGGIAASRLTVRRACFKAQFAGHLPCTKTPYTHWRQKALYSVEETTQPKLCHNQNDSARGAHRWLTTGLRK